MRSVSNAGSVTASSSAAPHWRWALPRIALLFAATRAFLLAVAAIVETTQATPSAGVRLTDAPLLASLTAFDGRYYLGIAASGYHAAPVYGPYVDHVFFPFYPIVVRVGSILTLGNVDLAGVLVANAAFGAALVTLYALSIRHLSRENALWSLIFLALAPGAVAFGLAYTDSLFLLLAVGAFLATETRRPAAMGLLFALATLTRPLGILLAVPLLLLIRDDPELRARRSWAWLLLGPLALAGFSAHLWGVTGDPLAWLHGQALWSHVTPAGGDVVTGVGTAAGSTVGMSPASATATLLWLATLAFYVFLCVYFRRDRMPRGYVAWSIIAIATVFSAGRLQPAPRYLAVAWPFDWTLALRRSTWIGGVVLVIFVALQGLFAWLTFTWQSAP
jgi:hypothetical protein